MKKIVAICGDPGGANAVAPVIELLRIENIVSVGAYAYLQAATLWKERNLNFHEIAGDIPDSAIIEILGTGKANLLLCGTSVNRFELEKRFIAFARKLSLPSLAVLDFWSNYALRFSDDEGVLAYLPDRIAVMDQTALDEMVADGVDRSRIVITGHPAWDNLAEHGNRFGADEKARIRAALGIGENDWLVVYASQPPTFSDDSAESDVPPWQDRSKAVLALLHALQEISRKQRRKAFLLIRPHPRESADIYREIKCDPIRIILDRHADAHALMMSADLVVGMNTMFLVESSLLARPTLSIRLGMPLPDDFPPNRSGLVRAIYHEEALASEVEKMLTGAKAQAAVPIQDNAGKNVAELIHSMLDFQGE